MLLELIGDVLAPGACAACDARVGARVVMCPACARSVERLPGPPPGDRVVAFGAYGGALAEAVRRFKYAARPDLARPLGDLLRAALRAARARADVVVPVPLHPSRLAERGYNQAALLARAAARELGAPAAPAALVRVVDTPAQAGLDAAARRRNVAGAFRTRRPAAVADRRVLLVDDVCATGATIAACAGALIDAGAASVRAAVVARSTVSGA